MSGTANKAIWQLRLYIADGSSLAEQAIRHVEATCEKFVPGKYQLEVIDVAKDPSRALEDDIIAIPTLVRLAPGPKRRVFGVADMMKLATALDLPARQTGNSAPEKVTDASR